MGVIKIVIAEVGNCTSVQIKGIEYYKIGNDDAHAYNFVEHKNE